MYLHAEAPPYRSLRVLTCWAPKAPPTRCISKDAWAATAGLGFLSSARESIGGFDPLQRRLHRAWTSPCFGELGDRAEENRGSPSC